MGLLIRVDPYVAPLDGSQQAGVLIPRIEREHKRRTDAAHAAKQQDDSQRNLRHPLAVSVNRDERSTASRPRTLSLQNLSSQLRAHRTLGSRTLVAPKRTSHPSGSRPSRLAARRPLAAFAAPENPLFPTASNNRSRTCQPHSSVASPIGAPTPCGSRYGRNELIDMGGIGAGVQSAVMVLPTFVPHCRRRPH